MNPSTGLSSVLDSQTLGTPVTNQLHQQSQQQPHYQPQAVNQPLSQQVMSTNTQNQWNKDFAQNTDRLSN